MIAELYEALTHAKIPADMARQASEAVENVVEKLILQNNEHSNSEFYTEKIVPIEKENIGIRAEIRVLSETMKAGFETIERIFEARSQAVDKQFQAVDKRIDLLTKLFWLLVGLMVTGFSTTITILLKFVMK